MGEYREDQSSGTFKDRLSRRAAIGRAAGVGAVAALTASGLSGRGASAASGSSSVRERGAHMAQSTPVASPVSGTPTVVLVHGAFADASGWAGVISLLQA